jgi:hypothetical protein
MTVNFAKATEARGNSSPGRALHKPSSHCRREGRDVSAALYAAVQLPLRYCAQRTAGASRRPAFPAPSAPMRAKRSAKLGQNMPRGCRRLLDAGETDSMSSHSSLLRCARNVGVETVVRISPRRRPRFRQDDVESAARAECHLIIGPLSAGVLPHPNECGEIASMQQKNPLSTVARRTLMNQPGLVHKRRPAADGSAASRA